MTTWQRRKGIMLCYPLEEKRLLKWPKPYLVQPKLEGDRCRALSGEAGTVLLSSEENPRDSVPIIKQQVEALRYALVDRGLIYSANQTAEFDGEFYVRGMPHDGEHGIHSIVSRTKNLHPNHGAMEYWIFDLVLKSPQIIRAALLESIPPILEELRLDKIRVVKHEEADDLEEVMDYLESYIKVGFEGIIVRNREGLYKRMRSIDIMKFKPKKSDIYKIVGVREEISKDGIPKGALGAFVCVDDMGTEFKVGSGPLLTRFMREALWKDRDKVTGCNLSVKYQRLTEKKVPLFATCIEIGK